MNEFDKIMKEALKNIVPTVNNLTFRLQQSGSVILSSEKNESKNKKVLKEIKEKIRELDTLKCIKIYDNQVRRVIDETEVIEESYITLFYGEYNNILEIRDLEDANKVIEALKNTHKKVEELINKAKDINILELNILKKQRLTFKDYEEMIKHFERYLEITEHIYKDLESLEEYKSYLDDELEIEKITKYLNYKRMLERFPTKIPEKEKTIKRGKI